MRLRARHVATCPEVSPPVCAAQEVPDHLHDQRITWFRLDPALHLGLGAGWQLSGTVPLDLRVLGVEYLTLDGAPYDPPYGEIHHRDEVLWGPADGSLQLAHYRRAGPWTVGGSLGSTLPLGRTEPNPYALAAQGEEHQHFQLGTGTFVPQGGAEAFLQGARWGGQGWVRGRLPVYENRHGYRPAPQLAWGLGPTWRAIPTVQLLLGVEGVHEGADRWDGGDAHATPRHAILGGGGVLWNVSAAVALQVQGRVTAWQVTLGEHGEDQLIQRFVGTAGLSWTFGAAPEDG